VRSNSIAPDLFNRNERRADIKLAAGICFVNNGPAETGADTLSLVGGFEGRGGPVKIFQGNQWCPADDRSACGSDLGRAQITSASGITSDRLSLDRGGAPNFLLQQEHTVEKRFSGRRAHGT
jgi:hypothetical protein